MLSYALILWNWWTICTQRCVKSDTLGSIGMHLNGLLGANGTMGFSSLFPLLGKLYDIEQKLQGTLNIEKIAPSPSILGQSFQCLRNFPSKAMERGGQNETRGSIAVVNFIVFGPAAMGRQLSLLQSPSPCREPQQYTRYGTDGRCAKRSVPGTKPVHGQSAA